VALILPLFTQIKVQNKMTVYLIRHGQSEFNAAHSEGEPDPMIFDAPLTKKGRMQAEQVRGAVMELGIQKVITSPLTRAIQTAVTIFQDIAPIKVMAEHRELLSHSCDVGRSPSTLQKEFPNLFFGHLDEIWWHQGPANKDSVPIEPRDIFQNRIRSFRLEISKMSDANLAIVGHGDVFRELAGVSMANCEIRKYETSD
jgi:broad specificity phosphatase PhoE